MIRLTQDADADRRRHHRAELTKPAKIRSTSRIAYTPAATVNLSSSGALLETPANHPLSTGDEVEIVIAWNDEPVLHRAAARRATVRRIAPAAPGRVQVALEFAAASASAELTTQRPTTDATTTAAAA